MSRMRKAGAVPLMPDELRGEMLPDCGYSYTRRRKWSAGEIDWIDRLRSDGYTWKEIAESVGRTHVSVMLKHKRLGKRNGISYNEPHRADKYAANDEFLRMIEPDSVLDLYAGNSYYRGKVGRLVTNDIDQSKDTDYHENAERLVHKLYYERNSFDVVDIDPFGSPYACLDVAVKMVTKGLAVTYGEIGMKRFKRLDFLAPRYGMESLDDFGTDKLIAETVRIGLTNKKRLVPVIVKEWNLISRVYYKIERIKITGQWRGCGFLNDDE